MGKKKKFGGHVSKAVHTHESLVECCGHVL